MERKLTAPSVHLNGTSHADLMKQYQTAYDALTAAIAALRESAPHGRDYYVQSPEAYTKAAAEHTWRLQQLEHIQSELFRLHLFIATQPVRGSRNVTS